MGRNLEFDSRVLELNSRFLPKASLPLCLGYSLPKKEKKFSTTALAIVAWWSLKMLAFVLIALVASAQRTPSGKI